MTKDKKQKTRKLSIRSKILIPVLIIILAVSSGMGALIFMIGNWALVNTGVEKSHLAANIASDMIDGSAIGEIGAGSEGTEAYETQLAELREIKETCGILYMYTIYQEGGNPYYNEYGDLISSYVPIYDEGGNVVAVLGCDYDGSEVVSLVSTIQMLTLVCTVVALVVSAIIVTIFVSRISKNIVIINQKIYDLVNNEGDLTQKLDIRSGDELELISNNVNNLLECCEDIIKIVNMINISGNSTNLKGASQEVFNNLKNAEMNITDVSATMEEMSAGMEETAASIVEITHSINGVYEAINEINEKAGSSATHAYQAMEKATGIYDDSIKAQENAKNRSNQISASVADKIEKAYIHPEIMGSDHCPVGLEITF